MKSWKGTRRALIAGIVGMFGGFALAASSIPSLQKLTSLWLRIARNPKTLTNTEVDLRGLELGQTMATIWNDRPIYIVRRTEAMVRALKTLTSDIVRDPNSDYEELPPGISPVVRSKNPEYLVVDGLCSHLGCSLAPVLPGEKADLSMGGFYCGCHGGKFDLAGRVLAGTPPPANLYIPPHHFQDATTLVIGQDEVV